MFARVITAKIGMFFLLLSSLLLSGCASVFVPYTGRMQTVRDQVSHHQYDKAIKAIRKMDDSQNTQLQALELGRVEQLKGDFKQSEKTYGELIKNVRANQLKAQVRLSHILENTGSVFVNDRVIPYCLSAYEIVFLYGYQALNYLGQHDLTDAMVSIRRAANEQEWIRQQQAKALYQAQQKARKKDAAFDEKKLAHYFTNLNSVAKMRAGNENLLLYYLSAVLYIAKDDMNDAFVSLQHALQVAPNNKQVQYLLLEVLVRRGGNLEQLHKYMKLFGVEKAPVVNPDDTLLVILYEQGFVPQKKEIQVTVPLFVNGYVQLQRFALPTYDAPYAAPEDLPFKLNRKQYFTTELMSVYPLAARALKKQLPGIYIREALRVIAKATAVAGAQKASRYGENDQLTATAAAALIQIYAYASSGADLRSWLTLPNSEQIFDQFLPAENTKLLVYYRGLPTKIGLHLKPHQVNLLWLVGQGPKLIVHNLPIEGS